MDDVCGDEMLHINDLPVEILRYIMSFFTQSELLLTVAPVCQLWCQLAYDPVRWQTLSFDLSNESITSDTLQNCFERFPLLRCLEIIGGRYSHFLLSPADIRCCAMYCDKVVDLQLRFISSLDLEMTIELVQKFPQLETLNVEGCEQLDHKCVVHLCELSHLYKLNISHCSQLMDKTLAVIASSVLPLQALNIDGLNRISDRAVVNFLHNYGSRLQELHLDGEELTDASIDAVCGCSVLRCLKISFSGQLTDNCLSSLKKMSSLRELGIRKGSQLTSNGLNDFFERSSLKELTYLDLSECSNLTNDAVQALCRCCGSNLCHLALSWCWYVTEAGLCSIVNTCKNLKYLDIIGLHMLTGECLERVPELVPHLTFLDLRQCNCIQDSVVEALVRCKRDLTAIDYYGDKFSGNSPQDAVQHISLS